MRDLRVKTVLQEILANDASSAKVIGITAHWGVIQSALKVLGYPDVVNIGTAGTIPVVVKVEKYGGLADGGWYDAYREKDRGELALRSVCPGYPEILVQGQYAVPGGMGIDT